MERVNLLDESAFEAGGGLWTGKKGALVTATVIRNTNFTESGRVDYSDVAVLQVEEKQLATRRLKRGDIIIERSGGGPSQPVGRVVFFDRDDGVYSHSNFTSCLRVIDTGRFDPRFVFYFLLYFHDSGQTEHLQRRTTGIRNLDWRAYRESAGVPLFEWDEQRQVAAVLSAVQRAIERQGRLIALTAELKKALLQKLFTEGARGESLKQTEIGSVPESWRIERLVNLLREPLRNGHSAKETADPNGIRTLTLTAVTRADFSVANTKTTVAVAEKVRNLWLRSGDIFIERANTLDYIGLAALYEGPDDFAIFPDLLVRVRLDEAKVLPKVLCEYLVGSSVRQYFRMNAKGTAGNFPKIDQGIIENLQVPVPWPEEQAEIEDAARTLDTKYAAHAAMRRCYEDLFHTLLHQLMTAQVRVHDLSRRYSRRASCSLLEQCE